MTHPLTYNSRPLTAYFLWFFFIVRHLPDFLTLPLPE